MKSFSLFKKFIRFKINSFNQGFIFIRLIKPDSATTLVQVCLFFFVITPVIYLVLSPMLLLSNISCLRTY